jgi:hypothetical protein
MSSPPSRRDRIRIVAVLLFPLIAFIVLQQVVGNATGALAITDAIPLLWVVAIGIWHRRVDRVALIPVAIFTLALVLTIAFGGSSLPLELRRAVFPGALGVACLISLAVHRPLLAVGAARLAQARGQDPGSGPKLDTPGAQRALITLTAIVGVAAIFDAAAQIVLALTLSTADFAELARVASYVIIGSGLAACALYLRRVRAQLRQSERRPTES